MLTQTTPQPGQSLLDRIGNTPLLRLDRFNHWVGEKVRIYAKAEFANPGGSVKDRPAKNMLLEAVKDGRLTKEKIILDSTSGNTGIAYAMLGTALGYRVQLVMPDTASEKKRVIESFGARIVLTDPMEGSDGAQLEAQRIYEADPRKYFMPDQYNNADNWKAHYRTTAEEIWKQTDGKITHFLAGLGTGGTLTGTGRRLKELNPAIQVIAVEPATALHGLEGLKHMESSIVPGIYDAKVHDRKISVYTEDAYEMCCRLAREEGLLTGFSSGAALHAAFEAALGIQEGLVVTVFPDAGERYLRTRFWEEVLDYFHQYWKEHEK
jgi:S-sulfo-L-cysteine synthase (O-acetyl-L-serine-dependent)